ncbi:MAG: D-alanyl-D-alanine carboxypeptidase/D-alanyl-D-alanine-endopeptidase [Pseudomonadota bacterium]|jgi:D-alanyl-D-alanine carboxypeptidase/D-alanyl-D-alanine-endopeptidase (penicillin-binding protein 4)
MKKKILFLLKFLFIIFYLISPVTFASENNVAIQRSELWVDLTHSKILYAKNDQLRLIPASVTKLFIAASALAKWGSRYTFTTQVYARGNIKAGVLNGDLVFYGLGDPEFTNEKIWSLINNLQQIGLKKVTGNLIVNSSYFGKIILDDPDHRLAKSHSKVAYNGLPSSMGSDFGNIAVFIAPGSKIGDVAIVKVLPYPLDNILLKGAVRTVSGKNSTIQLSRNTQNDREILSISGTLGVKSEPITIYRSVGNPNLTTANLFVAFLKHAGISLNGKIKLESTPLLETDKLLTQLNSDPLIHSLQDMLFYSNNYIADMLMLDLWRESQSKSTTSIQLSQATQLLFDNYKPMLASTQFITENINDLPIFKNASGLTPLNRISAKDLIILLAGMAKNKRDFPFYYGSLVMPGQQTVWRGMITAQHPWMEYSNFKTGHISVPRSVYTIAGYFSLQNGDLGAFAVLFNAPPSMDKNGNVFKQLIQHLDHEFQTLRT